MRGEVIAVGVLLSISWCGYLVARVESQGEWGGGEMIR